VEACGDDPWFADSQIRLALRDAVEMAHASFKIIVRDPAEEIVRICPHGGHALRAGAILRLGGSHLGGYGEADVSYAYRQLSRALHPDKNPNNSDAAAAFRRLKEAQHELTRSLEEARGALQRLSAQFSCCSVAQEELARPQAAVFAEATHLLSAVLGLATEGHVPAAAWQRATACLHVSAGAGGGGWAAPAGGRGPQEFLEEWFTDTELLLTLSTDVVRNAYDCAPKRYRAHFLCLLARLALLEGQRNAGCVRQAWSGIWEVFPELVLWQQLRARLQQKCRVHGRNRQRERSRSPRRDRAGSSSIAEDSEWSQWAQRWRKVIRAVLPGGEAAAAVWSDPEVRKLCAALWRDFIDPIEKKVGCGDFEEASRCLGLFRTESRGAADVAEQLGAAPAEWAFVPAADLLLIVGDGLVGMTIEGVFKVGDSTQRLAFASAIFQTMM